MISTHRSDWLLVFFLVCLSKKFVARASSHNVQIAHLNPLSFRYAHVSSPLRGSLRLPVLRTATEEGSSHGLIRNPWPQADSDWRGRPCDRTTWNV